MMNKYQEALDRLSNIDLQQYGEDTFGDGRLTPLYACDCYREEFDALLELVDKTDRYRWHDLRKDPEDLPKENNKVLAIFKGENTPSIIDCLNGEFGHYVDYVHFELEGNLVEEYFEFYDPDEYEVIAWKYIEEFKDE